MCRRIIWTATLNWVKEQGFGGIGLWVLDGSFQPIAQPRPTSRNRQSFHKDIIKSSQRYLKFRPRITRADLVCASPARAAEPNPIKTTLEPLNRFSRMVQEYFVERLRRFETANRKAKTALKNEAYQSFSQGLARLGYVVFI